jgi:glyoxylate/hydroxypyruvate reductase A
MSTILVAVDGPQAGDWLTALRAHAKGHEILAWPDPAIATGDIGYACVWLPPRGLLARFPQLKAIINLGAGVDHLLDDPTLPPVPIARVIHADLSKRVIEYVVLHVLMHHRRQRLYDAQQQQRLWRAHDQSAASEVTVGVMGLGAIGRPAASALTGLGFRVAGFSRGQRQIDADIVAALDEGALAAATLDVFPEEPLPRQSPLWNHPKVTITPHNAGDISPRVFAPHVIDQIERFERGLPLDHQIDRSRGY